MSSTPSVPTPHHHKHHTQNPPVLPATVAMAVLARLDPQDLRAAPTLWPGLLGLDATAVAAFHASRACQQRRFAYARQAQPLRALFSTGLGGCVARHNALVRRGVLRGPLRTLRAPTPPHTDDAPTVRFWQRVHWAERLLLRRQQAWRQASR